MKSTNNSANSIAFDNLMWTTFSGGLSTEDNISLDKNIVVYPNPSNSIINIQNTELLKIASINLIDITGKNLIDTSNTSSIDVSNFIKGMYILKITSENGSVISKKIIVN